jgi:hypothetical protein
MDIWSWKDNGRKEKEKKGGVEWVWDERRWSRRQGGEESLDMLRCHHGSSSIAMNHWSIRERWNLFLLSGLGRNKNMGLSGTKKENAEKNWRCGKRQACDMVGQWLRGQAYTL